MDAGRLGHPLLFHGHTEFNHWIYDLSLKSQESAESNIIHLMQISLNPSIGSRVLQIQRTHGIRAIS